MNFHEAIENFHDHWVFMSNHTRSMISNSHIFFYEMWVFMNGNGSRGGNESVIDPREFGVQFSVAGRDFSPRLSSLKGKAPLGWDTTLLLT